MPQFNPHDTTPERAYRLANQLGVEYLTALALIASDARIARVVS